MSKYRLQRAFKDYDVRTAKEVVEFPGELGVRKGGQYQVEVPNRPGYCYVRLLNNLSELVIAYNNGAVSLVYGLPVRLARNKTDQNKWYILGRDVGRYNNWGASSYLPPHGDQHSFNPWVPGADPTWVWQDQFMPMNGVPSGTNGSLNLVIEPSYYYINDVRKYIGLTGSPDLTAFLPTSGSSRFVLVYADTNGNPGVLAGSPFASSISGSSEINAYIPVVTGSFGVPIRAVRLEYNTSFIPWASTFDMRPFYTWGASSSGGGGGSTTGTASQTFPAERIPYAGSDGVLTHHPWFNLRKVGGVEEKLNILIGTSGTIVDTSEYLLSIVSSRSNYPAGTFNYAFATFMFGTANPIQGTYRSNGTEAAPTMVEINDNIIDWRFYGMDNFPSFEEVAMLKLTALEDFTIGNYGTVWKLYNTEVGNNNLIVSLYLANAYAKFSGYVQIPDDEAYYWGDAGTNGSWRETLDGATLVYQKRVAGVWVTQSTVLPSFHPARVPFAGADTLLTQNHLFNFNRIGGDNAKVNLIVGGAGTDAEQNSYAMVAVDDYGGYSDTGSGGYCYPFATFTYGDSPRHYHYFANGAEYQPTQVSQWDDIHEQGFMAWSGDGTWKECAFFRVTLMDNLQNLSRKSYFNFVGFPSGSASAVSDLYLSDDYARFGGDVQVSHNRSFVWGNFNSYGPSPSISGTWQLYSDGGSVIRWRHSFGAGWDTHFSVYTDHVELGSTTKHQRTSDEGVTYWVGTSTGIPYGSCLGVGIGWNQVAAQNTWYQVSDADCVDGKINQTFHTNGSISVNLAGTYFVSWMTVISSSVADVHIQTAVSITPDGGGASVQNDGLTITQMGANAERTVSSSCILTLAVNDAVSISIRTTDAGGPTISVDNLSLVLYQIGG